MKYIILVVLSIVLCCSVYFLKDEIFRGENLDSNLSKLPSAIPPLDLEREMEFSIVKGRYETLIFKGKFSDPNTPKNIAKLLNKNIISKIIIDKDLKENREIVEFTKEIISKLNNKLLEWSIIYRDKKLLIEGKTANIRDKESIDILLAISNINYFNNIEIVEEDNLEVVETLKSIVPKQSIDSDKIDRDDAEDIISNLKEVVSISQVREKESIKKKISKRVKVKKRLKRYKKRETIRASKPKKVKRFMCNENIKIDKKKVDREDSDIMSLPHVKFIDNNTKPIEVKKHVIDRGTIYLPPSKKDEIEPKDIPWAKLYDIDEKTDGIFIPESVNKEQF